MRPGDLVTQFETDVDAYTVIFTDPNWGDELGLGVMSEVGRITSEDTAMVLSVMKANADGDRKVMIIVNGLIAWTWTCFLRKVS